MVKAVVQAIPSKSKVVAARGESDSLPPFQQYGIKVLGTLSMNKNE
jgi:hypothetical protein